MDGGRRNQYHSLICTCTVYCTTSIAYIYTSRILPLGRSGSEVNLFSRVVEFANSTRLVKFAKIKPPWNIWRIQYPESSQEDDRANITSFTDAEIIAVPLHVGVDHITDAIHWDLVPHPRDHHFCRSRQDFFLVATVWMQLYITGAEVEMIACQAHHQQTARKLSK